MFLIKQNTLATSSLYKIYILGYLTMLVYKMGKKDVN